MAATHKGTCQCCGRVQKLPKGVLANHGYEVVWGTFNGICRGAGALPYEQSCDLIKYFIEGAQETIDLYQKNIEQLRQPATEDKAWVHEYISGRTRGVSGYMWRYVDLIFEGYVVYYMDINGKKTRQDIYGVYSGVKQDKIDYLNAFRIRDYGKEIKALQEYITWQQKRVDNWKEKDLIEMKGEK